MQNALKFGGITFGLVILALILVFSGLVGWVSWRQRQFENQEDTRDLPDRAATMAATYLKKRPRAALVIGLFNRGETWVGGFGAFARDGNSITPNGDSIYEIGSITKVFTGIALADLAERGVVEVIDPVGKHMAGLDLPEDGRGNITLKQLATHRSGLPRLPKNFWDVVGDHRDNPYANYSLENLFADFKSVKLNHPPGSHADYSNYGTALLGQVLALAAASDYELLVEERILQPLELSETMFVVSEEDHARLIGGFTPSGEPTSSWDFDAMSPAGGLKSTANDMLKFIRANLNPDGTSIGAPLKLALSEHASSNLDRMGLGWHWQETVEELGVWWHNGGTGGYASFLGIDPANQTGVIVLSNHGDAMAGLFDVDKIGMNLLRLAAKVSLK